MQELGKFKGCAYAKFDYNPYKTYWVYSLQNGVQVRGRLNSVQHRYSVRKGLGVGKETHC